MCLIKEVPAQSKTENAAVHGIVRHQERGIAATIDMAHHHEEARVFQIEVDIGIDHWEIAYFDSALPFLRGELPKSRTIVGSIILRKVSSVGTHVHIQHMRNLEP